MKSQNSFSRNLGVVLSVLVLGLFLFRPLVAAQAPAKHKQAQKPTKQKTAPEPVWDLVISGGMVVTIDAPHRILENGIVAVQVDLIVAVEPPTPPTNAEYTHAAMHLIFTISYLVIPRLINS